MVDSSDDVKDGRASGSEANTQRRELKVLRGMAGPDSLEPGNPGHESSLPMFASSRSERSAGCECLKSCRYKCNSSMLRARNKSPENISFRVKFGAKKWVVFSLP